MSKVKFECEYINTRTPKSYICHIDRDPSLPKSLYQVLSVGYEYNEAGYRNKRSGGSSYLIAYTKSGQAEMVYEGQRYAIMPGSLIFIHLANASLIEAAHSPWEIYFVHVYGSDIDDIYRSFVKVHGYYLANIEADFFVDCVQRVYDCAAGEGDLYGMSGQLYLMLMSLLKLSADIKRTELVSRAVDYLNHHFMEEIHIEALAKELFVSKSFLIREFYKDTGSTPKQYLTNIRLQKARLLLIHTNMTIRKIAEESGFGTEKNIFYAFRKELNTTPTEFRKHIYEAL